MATIETGSLTVATTRVLGHVVVTLHGELDVASAPTLQSNLSDIIEQQGNLDVVVDLASLEFIDSRGLSVLIGADRMLKERGGNLALSAPRPQVRRVFEVMGLARHLTLTET